MIIIIAINNANNTIINIINSSDKNLSHLLKKFNVKLFCLRLSLKI